MEYEDKLMTETQNRILKQLPPDEFEKFLSCSELIDLKLKDTVIEPNKPIEWIDFVESGVHSMIAIADSEKVEVATVGREGMVGIAIVLGQTTSICECFCQVPGKSFRIATSKFKELLNSCPVLASACMRYCFSVFEQASQNSACNRLHSIEERCAKWLLLCHDRVNESEFELTQEFLAQMLGVRRQSVNLAAGILQTAGIIKYSRGMIRILQREELEQVSCECYKLIRKAMDL